GFESLGGSQSLSLIPATACVSSCRCRAAMGRRLAGILTWSLMLSSKWLLPELSLCVTLRENVYFDKSAGWSMDRAKKDFTVVGPNKVELSEMPEGQPPADTSLELATDTAVSAWLALGGSSTHQAFDLSGKKWKGRAVILSMHSQQLVLFVAKSKNKYFRHFTLSIPVEEWKNNSQQYLGILRTLEFSDSK